MNRETKIVIILVIILAVVCGVIFFNKQENKSQVTNSNTVLNETAQNVTEEILNKVENTNTFEENNDKKEDNTNTVENNSSNTNSSEKTSENDSDRAIEMVKNEWGKDDNVTFKVDEQTEDGKYVVCVMETSTTRVIMWYNVDVKNNTIEEK